MSQETVWYYARNGRHFGPFTVTQLRDAATNGDFCRTDLIWREGIASWVPASEVKGLFPPNTSNQNSISNPNTPFSAAKQSISYPQDQSRATRLGSTQARWGFALSLIGLCTSCILIGVPIAIAGLIVSIIAKTNISKSVDPVKGSGLATSGIILSVAILVITPLLTIPTMLSVLGPHRRIEAQMKNSTQVRGIIQGCILYSQGNSDYYPGISVATGIPTVVRAANPAVPDQGAGTVIDRIQALINGNYFTPEYALNPVASDEHTTSYAMLRISRSYGNTPTNRSSEWKNTTNSTAIVISDRSIANGTGYRSWWTSPSNNTTDWRGSVCWNDNHVTFETSLTVANTKYTRGNTNTIDDIFAGSDTDYDAFNVWSNATTR